MGISSGMDINSMVSKIVDSSVYLNSNESIMNERESIPALVPMEDSENPLIRWKTWWQTFVRKSFCCTKPVESTDEALVSATATTEAIAGKYAIDVLQLAQSHKVASDVLSEDMKFGPGKLQVSLGDDSFDVQVGDRSKLIDIVRSINGADSNPGVRASVINDVEGPRLIVASNQSGSDQQISINVESDAANPLKKLEYKTLEERVKALESSPCRSRRSCSDSCRKSCTTRWWRDFERWPKCEWNTRWRRQCHPCIPNRFHLRCWRRLSKS